MKLDIEKSLLQMTSRKIKIPKNVLRLLENEDNFKESLQKEAKHFLGQLDAKRIGYNGFKVDVY